MARVKGSWTPRVKGVTLNWGEREEARLKAMAELGLTVREMVARMPGRSYSAVWQRLQKLGIKDYQRAAVWLTDDERKAILGLQRAGLPPYRVARELGIKPRTVCQEMASNGEPYVREAEYQEKRRRVGFIQAFLADDGGYG